MNCYVQGTLVQVAMTITDSSGIPVAPSVVTFRTLTPDGVVSDLSGHVVNPSEGNYSCDVSASQIGLTRYEWVTTGSIVASGVGQFLVNQSIF